MTPLVAPTVAVGSDRTNAAVVDAWIATLIAKVNELVGIANVVLGDDDSFAEESVDARALSGNAQGMLGYVAELAALWRKNLRSPALTNFPDDADSAVEKISGDPSEFYFLSPLTTGTFSEWEVPGDKNIKYRIRLRVRSNLARNAYDLPNDITRAILANSVGLSSRLRLDGWEFATIIPGKTLASSAWSGTAWYANCTDGTVHKSLDGVTWSVLPVTIAAPARIHALDEVVVSCDYNTGVKVSLDGGATWQSHTPYGGSPNTHNASCILRIGAGVYRIFDGGQTWAGATSGIIASADTDAMPAPGDAWTVRYSGVSAAVFNVAQGPTGVISATTLPSGNIAALTSPDGEVWTTIDTGISAASGRSIFYSDIYSTYFLGATAGGATGSVITSTDLVSFAETITGFGGPVDSFTEADGGVYCGAGNGGAWRITSSTKVLVSSGNIANVAGNGDDLPYPPVPPGGHLFHDQILAMPSTFAGRLGYDFCASEIKDSSANLLWQIGWNWRNSAIPGDPITSEIYPKPVDQIIEIEMTGAGSMSFVFSSTADGRAYSGDTDYPVDDDPRFPFLYRYRTGPTFQLDLLSMSPVVLDSDPWLVTDFGVPIITSPTNTPIEV